MLRTTFPTSGIHVDDHLNLHRRFNYERWCTDGNIQGAIDALPDTGGVINLPEGDMPITSPLVGKGNLILSGRGMRATRIICNGCDGLVFRGSENLDENSWNLSLRNLTLRGDYTADKNGMYIDHAANIEMERVMVECFAGYGIGLNWVLNSLWMGCIIRDNDGDGVYHREVVKNIVWDGGCIWNCNGWGIKSGVENGDWNSGLTLIGINVEGNREGGLLADYTSALNVIGCHFEGNRNGNREQTAPEIGYNMRLGSRMVNGGVHGVNIIGTHFSHILGAGGEGYHVTLDRVNGASIAGNYFTAEYTEAITQDSVINLDISPGNYYGQLSPA